MRQQLSRTVAALSSWYAPRSPPPYSCLHFLQLSLNFGVNSLHAPVLGSGVLVLRLGNESLLVVRGLGLGPGLGVLDLHGSGILKPVSCMLPWGLGCAVRCLGLQVVGPCSSLWSVLSPYCS